MIYIDGFSLPNGGTIDDYAYPTAYPYGVFELMDLDYIKFDRITVFYGGNGSGKSTLLRLIGDKCGLEHKTEVDQTEHYQNFLRLCHVSYYEEEDFCYKQLPSGSKIITSEDIMDHILQLRVLNHEIGTIRDTVQQEYWEKAYSPNRLNSLSEFDEFKRRNRMKRLTKTHFVNEEGGVRKKEHSNGEHVLLHFEQELEARKVYLLDEPEVSLSPKYQRALADKILELARFHDCQFVIATHSPFILGIEGSAIFNMDERPVKKCDFEELENMQLYYEFFKKFEHRFRNNEN